MSYARAQQRHKKEIESIMIKLALEGGTAAIKRQIRLLRRFRNAFAGKPGLSNFVDNLDWGLECCYRQHPAYTESINKFVESIA
jgi:hypothetical protein